MPPSQKRPHPLVHVPVELMARLAQRPVTEVVPPPTNHGVEVSYHQLTGVLVPGAQLRTGNQNPRQLVVRDLNSVIRGWGNYFSYGTLSETRHQLDWYVYERVRAFLRRRHKVKGLGTVRFSVATVRGELGVLALAALPRAELVNAWA